MMRLVNWERWQNLSVHQRIAWTRRVLPVTIFVIVSAVQAWLNLTRPSHSSTIVHLGIEVLVYALLGPLVIWYVLLWIEHQVREKELMERRLREQEQRLLQIRDEVSAQIASDLHDSLGPKLFALALKADVCKRLLRADPCQVEQELSMISATLQESIREVRRAVYALRPIELERVGLFETLRKLAAEAKELDQTSLELHISGEERRLPQEIEVGLYYIVQEALYNVRKHAEAQRVIIGVDLGPRVICLTVRDDGKGFDPATTPEGIGLRHMRERALSLGGNFAIHAARGEGTELRVCLPILREDAMRRIRILIADDHNLVRQALAQMLQTEPDFEVVGQAADGDEAFQKAKLLDPDIVLMDIHMPRGREGIEATQRIAEHNPRIGVIMLTMERHDEYLIEAIKAGAKGYLLKNANSQELIEAIRAVAAGEAQLDSAMARRVLEEFRRLSARHDAVHLTEREVEILQLVAQGASNKEIAKRLEISEKTVRNRLSVIFDKLHINNRTEAALYALREGYASLPSDPDKSQRT